MKGQMFWSILTQVTQSEEKSAPGPGSVLLKNKTALVCRSSRPLLNPDSWAFCFCFWFFKMYLFICIRRYYGSLLPVWVSVLFTPLRSGERDHMRWHPAPLWHDNLNKYSVVCDAPLFSSLVVWVSLRLKAKHPDFPMCDAPQFQNLLGLYKLLYSEPSFKPCLTGCH